MTKSRIFIVNDDSWAEHNKVGIAAINDPLTTHPQIKTANAARQSAIAEISGIRPGDTLFFNCMVSEKHPPQILGIFEATSSPYFDPTSLFQGARHVNQRLPFRVEFKCLHNFLNPINIEEIWALRDKGTIWTLQQSRGDAVGVHACVGITRMESKILQHLLKVNNLVEGPRIHYQSTQKNKRSLPIDLRIDKPGELHYEAALTSVLLENFADGKNKHLFGDYDEFLSYIPTGARKEIDILLLKYNESGVLWYQILELKHDVFTMHELQNLIGYEKWIIRSQAENPLQVYPVAVAFEFNQQVINFVTKRKDYKERPITLIKYRFDPKTKSINLNCVSPTTT